MQNNTPEKLNYFKYMEKINTRARNLQVGCLLKIKEKRNILNHYIPIKNKKEINIGRK